MEPWSVSSETVEFGDYSFADHWGHLRSRWFGLFSGCGGWYGSFSGFLHPDACRRERRHSFHHANAGRIRALHDGGFSLNSWLILLKILSVVLFIYLTSPTSSHALMRAAFEDDEMPLTEEDLKKSSRKKRRKK